MKQSKHQTMESEKGIGLYSLSMVSRKIALPFNVVDAYVKRTLNEKLIQEVEGKCIEQGFVKPNSVRILFIWNISRK
jgi:hypothetical protein